jgi:hypothetical protein
MGRAGPRITLAELTPDERAFVDALLQDEPFVGDQIQWGEASKVFQYKVAKLEQGAEIQRDKTGKPTYAEKAVLDAKGEVVYEEQVFTSKWRTYKTGGTDIRASVFEDAVRGVYGELPRDRVRASTIRIVELVDLSFLNDLPAVEIEASWVEGIDLRDSVIRKLDLGATSVGGAGINAENLRATADVFLDDGFEVHGPVDLNSSTIGGALGCGDGRFLHTGQNCLRADNLKVTGSVFLEGGFEAHGPVDLNASIIGIQLSCRGGRFLSRGGDCFRADHLRVSGSVFLDEGFEAHGSARINGSTIGGGLHCNGRFLHSGENCLRAGNLKVTGSVFLNHGFEAHGSVFLNSCTIGGQLNCGGGRFLEKGNNCLAAFGLNVTGALFLSQGFEAQGSVYLNSSNVGAGIAFSGGQFLNQGENSLQLRWTTIGSDIISNSTTIVKGVLGMANASVGATATFDGEISSLDLEDAHLNGTLKISSERIQKINLTEATIEKFDDRVALSGTSGTARKCCWVAYRCDLGSKVSTLDAGPQYKLAGVKIKTFDPDFLRSSGTQKASDLMAISAEDVTLGNWIEASDQGAFTADVYDSFAEVLARQGRPEVAKYLLIRKNRHRRKKLGWWRQQWEKVFLDLPIAYGYRPGQVFGALAVAWMVSAVVVCLNPSAYSPVGPNRAVAVDLQKENSPAAAGVVTTYAIEGFPFGGWVTIPTPAPAYVTKNSELRMQHGAGFVEFVPSMYALDYLVPIISFNQKANWDVDRTTPGAWLLVGGQWFATVTGWVLTTLFVSSITGLVKNRF